MWAVLTDGAGWSRLGFRASIGVDGSDRAGRDDHGPSRSASPGPDVPGQGHRVRPRRGRWSSERRDAARAVQGRPDLPPDARRRRRAPGSTMREEYSGPLVPMMWRSMPDLGPSFSQFADGLEARASSSRRLSAVAAPLPGRRPVRGARRPEPAGDRRAARRGRPRALGRRARRRAADQPAGGLAPPPAAEGGRPGRRGAARDAAHLPAPRRGARGRPRLSRTGLGRRRGAVPARRREHDRRAARPVIEPIRLTFEVACPPEHAFEVWTARHRSVVAGRSHGHRRPTTCASSSSRGPAAGSSSGRRRASSTTGARSRSGSRRAGSATCGTCAAIAPTRPRSRSGSSPRRTATTRVEIEHRGWEALGAEAETWRDRNHGGWATLLPWFVAAAAGRECAVRRPASSERLRAAASRPVGAPAVRTVAMPDDGRVMRGMACCT